MRRDLAIVPVLCALLGVVVPTATPAGGQAPEQGVGPAVGLVHVDPWVSVGDQLHLDLAVDSTDGLDPARDLRVTVHAPVTSPEALAASLAVDVGPVLFTATVPVASLPTPESGLRRVSLDVSATVNEGLVLRMATPGVYPVVVVPVGDDGTEGDPLRTPVIRLDQPDEPAGLALTTPELGVIVDVTTAPTIQSAGRRPFTDAEAQRFHRLAGLLTPAQEAGVPFAPVTITTTADALAGIVGSDRPAAHLLYGAMVAATEGQPPMADIVAQGMVALDVPDLLAAGLDELVIRGARHGEAAVRTELGPADEQHWLATGRFDTASAELVAGLGYRTLLLADDQLEPTGDDDTAEADAGDAPTTIVAADSALGGVPAALNVAVIDTATSHWLTDPADTLADRADLAAIALAELILRTPEPGTGLVVRVDDVPEGSPLEAVVPLLTRSDTPVSLVPVTELAGSPRAGDDDPALSLSRRAATDELRPVIDGVGAVDRHITTLTGMLEDQAPLLAAGELMIGALSSGLSVADRQDLLDAGYRITSQIIDNLTFTGSTNLNITSRRATLPIMFDNGNTFPVTAVVVARSDRLAFPEGDRLTVELAPGITRVDLPVEALASGSVPLFVELQNHEGAIVLPQQQFNVRSTVISGVGLLVSGGALLVLVAWWVRTWRRRER